MLPIDKKLITHNYSGRNGQKVQFIVVHDTANPRAGANAQAHFKYFNGADRQASAHYFVDDEQILQLVEDTQAAWHCGDGRGQYGITNQNSLGVEICINGDGDYDQAVAHTVELVRHLMDKHKVPIEGVVRHYDASRKICPATMQGNNWAGWLAFREALKSKATDNLTSAVEALVAKGLLNSPEYWIRQARTGKTVEGKYAALFIERLADLLLVEERLVKALGVLVQNGLINSPDYWLRQARDGQMVEGQYAGFLIERAAALLPKN